MTKRLYRNTADKKIAGVCSGIANYFEVDPTLIRIAWLIGFFCWGTGLLAYFLAMAIMPAEYC